MEKIRIGAIIYVAFFLVLIPWLIFPWLSGEGLITEYNFFAFVILAILIIIGIFPKIGEYLGDITIQ